MFLAHHFSNDKNVDKHTLFYEKLSHTARQNPHKHKQICSVKNGHTRHAKYVP